MKFRIDEANVTGTENQNDLFTLTKDNQVTLSNQAVLVGDQKIEHGNIDLEIKRNTKDNVIQLSNISVKSALKDLEGKGLDNELKVINNAIAKATQGDVIALSGLKVEQAVKALEKAGLDNEAAIIRNYIANATKEDTISLSGISVDRALVDLATSEVNLEQKKKMLPLVIQKAEQDLRKGEISIEAAIEALRQSKELFPLEFQQKVLEIEGMEIDNEEKKEMLIELLKKHRRVEIEWRYRESGLKQEQIQNMYSIADQIMTAFPDMDPDKARELALKLGFSGADMETITTKLAEISKTNNQTKFNENFTQNVQITESITNLFAHEMANNTMYDKKAAAENVIAKLTANLDQVADKDQIKMITDMVNNHANGISDDAVLRDQQDYYLDILNKPQIAQATTLQGLKEILKSYNVPDDQVEILYAKKENEFIETFIQKLSGDAGLREQFLDADASKVMEIMEQHGFVWDGEDSTLIQVDNMKKRIMKNNSYALMTNKTHAEIMEGNITTARDNASKIIQTALEIDTITDQSALALQIINQNYVLSGYSVTQVIREMQKIQDENNFDAGQLVDEWIATHGPQYQSIGQYKKGYLSSNGGDATYNAEENQNLNEGFVSSESVANLITNNTETKLNSYTEESNYEDSISEVSNYQKEVTKIFNQAKLDAFETHKTILEQNNKYNSDADVFSNEGYKAEISVLQEAEKNIKGMIDSKIEELNNIKSSKDDYNTKLEDIKAQMDALKIEMDGQSWSYKFWMNNEFAQTNKLIKELSKKHGIPEKDIKKYLESLDGDDQ
jgi:ribonuclease HI